MDLFKVTSVTPDPAPRTQRHGASRRPAVPHDVVWSRRRRLHTGIFHMHCIALRRRDASCRAGSGVKEPLQWILLYSTNALPDLS